MSHASCEPMTARDGLGGAILAAAILIASAARGIPLQAAETADPVPMRRTYIALTLEAQAPPAIRTSFVGQPPTIVLEFPSQRVIGSLPEHSAVRQGAIQTIETRYSADARHPSTRYIQSIRIGLAAPYAYRVRSDARRIIVEIEHPASVGSVAMELGLQGKAAVGGMATTRVDERFRAMQAALNSVTPIPWTPLTTPPAPESHSTATPMIAAPGSPATSPLPGSPAGQWLLFFISLGIGAAAVWIIRLGLEAAGAAKTAPVSGGMIFIDQLVWRAFERQGWQLVRTTGAARLPGRLRVIEKDGAQAALLCLGNGVFFEKQVVERFLDTLRSAELSQGFLAATGSFTVPAQRLARAHQVTLIGREPLIELIGVGAATEYVAQQLEQARVRLEEAQEQARQYTNELETLRRQRNEATWYLGEERTKSDKLQAQLDAVSEQLAQHEQELARWQAEAAALRTQWEESEWYLGEARARMQELEHELAALQETVGRAGQLERERNDAVGRFEKAEVRRQAMEQKLDELQAALQDVTKREQALQRAFDALNEEFNMVLAYGERRGAARIHFPEASVDLLDQKRRPIFSGCPENLSASGIGLETTTELPAGPLRIRVRFPGLTDPIESSARVVWQKALGTNHHRYRTGCRFVRLPASARAQLKELITQQHT